MTSAAGKPELHPSSYRDPSGYIFTYEGSVYRQVNQSFQKHFELFSSSGLYDNLVQAGQLIPHEVMAQNLTGDAMWYTTLKPEQLQLITYPYEWTFGMLKEAALLTIELALKALEHGMMLKDATPFNVQFHRGRMVFIDSLSFEQYKEGEPWIAYRQFCESFIGPLALMHYVGLPLQQLLTIYPDGIPVNYVKSLLPFRSKFNIHLYLHIHLHASVSAKPSSQQSRPGLNKQKIIHLFKSLQSLVQSLKFDRFENVWGDYYAEAESRPGYLEEKKEIISGWIASIPNLKTAIDVGGNAGEFAQLAARYCHRVICADGEHFAVERLYKKVKSDSLKNVVPLCIDFTNPSPAIGVNNQERSSFLQRAGSDLAMALALVHHLSIGKNIPFHLQAKMFAQLGRFLIIEFVKKEDEKVTILLQNKKDIYNWYTEESFLQSFSTYFRLINKRSLSSSPRTLYLMERL